MSLQLYIWGPAFGLASIEPESIAAVAYLKANVPIDRWVLLPDHGFSGSKPGKHYYNLERTHALSHKDTLAKKYQVDSHICATAT